MRLVSEGLLERAIDGHGAVVTVVGSPGIGKSRLVREVSAPASAMPFAHGQQPIGGHWFGDPLDQNMLRLVESGSAINQSRC